MRLVLFCLLLLFSLSASAQFTYGTTGLLHMPTADMQQDKTFMAGGSYLDKHATPDNWTYNTWNYYINMTFFPWLEVSYTCTIFNDYVRNPPVHRVNQDRQFSGRLRLWKEGWWKSWTPQIVVGSNDVLHGSDHGGDIGSVKEGGNTFFLRYYVAATKHIDWHGKWGLHAAYLYSERVVHKFNGVALGVNYRFNLPETSRLNKCMNGLNLIAEYDSRNVNIGAEYRFWKDYVNAVVEMNRCKYFSAGVVFKVHLK